MTTVDINQVEFEKQLLQKAKCTFIFPIVDNSGSQFILDTNDFIFEGSIGFENSPSFSDNIHLCIFRNSEYNYTDEITKEALMEIVNQYTFWKQGERSIGNFANKVTVHTNLVINEHSSTIKNLEKQYGLFIKRVQAPYF